MKPTVVGAASLAGPLPDVRQWRDLRSIDLDTNSFTGSLAGFASLPRLVVLVAHHLKLSGPLPPALCSVFECEAQANQFDCPLPQTVNGTACCKVSSCVNHTTAGDSGGSTGVSALIAPPMPPLLRSPPAMRRRVPMGQQQRADPGDTRPYGPGATSMLAVAVDSCARTIIYSALTARRVLHRAKLTMCRLHLSLPRALSARPLLIDREHKRVGQNPFDCRVTFWP